VSNSQNSLDTSNPTVIKLLEVDAELATQEVGLSAQLQSIQENVTVLKPLSTCLVQQQIPPTPIATPAQTPVAAEQAEVVAQQVEPIAKMWQLQRPIKDRYYCWG